MKILEIIRQVKNDTISPEHAESQIKLMIGIIVEGAAIGIGNVDATEMYAEINNEIEKI